MSNAAAPSSPAASSPAEAPPADASAAATSDAATSGTTTSGTEAAPDTIAARLPALTQEALRHLEELITREMPITRHLNFTLDAGDDGTLHANAPLQPNANHMGSAFGGSLSMLATLTGWAMAHQVVEEAMTNASEAMADMRRRVEILIQEGDIEYLKPVYENIAVICEPPDAATVAHFHDMLDRWGRARLDLKCKIDAAGERAVTFIGRYVALASDEELVEVAAGEAAAPGSDADDGA